jgi:predicted lipoprotein with Yx(FWY)xxD motif
MRAALAALAVATVFAAAPAVAQDTRLGPMGLVDSVGSPLYTYAGDTIPGQSACTGPCAATWLPFKADEHKPRHSHNWTVITRDDGTRQWAYRGKPLYLFSKDQPGASPTGLSSRWKAAW